MTHHCSLLRFRVFLFFRGFLVVLSLAWNAAVFAQTPQWIWPGQERLPNAVATWRKSVTGPVGLQRAQLSGVADFCGMSVRMNGKLVATAEGYGEPFFADVTRWMSDKENLLEVQANSFTGPAAIALRLEMIPAQGDKQILVTEKSWESTLATGTSAARKLDSVELGAVSEFELDPNRQFGITALDDYEQWKQALQTNHSTDPTSFLLVPDFQIELIRSATKDEGSWVSMAFDPRGRIVIGREDRGLLRMTLAADGRSIAKVETVDDTLLECRGLQFADDCLYANANNTKGLYRLRDSDGDDKFDEVKLLRQFEGGVGHGRNDLTLGPDGMLYLIHGDSVDLLRDASQGDSTSPFREHRRGQKTSEGHVLRTDRDGRHWKLLAAGLRNPYGIAFNTDGEMFTYDADAEFDMGSPWYRPTQVKHLVPGSDFGWRGVTGRWPPYYPDHPDNAQPSVHIGKGSPTSVKFGYGSRFPDLYRDALYILDWAYGRIIAVHLTPRGASYTGRAENFLKGRPLNVTDLDIGPDGAMYFVTGGRKTQAGLYRVRFNGPALPSPLVTIQQRERQQHSVAARSLRRELEALLDANANGKEREKGEIALDVAWKQLDSPDPSIRYAARMVVERQPLATWQDRALAEKQTAASLTALLALARSDDPSLRPRIVQRLNELPLASLTNSQKIAALYMYQLCLAVKDKLNSTTLQDAIQRLDAIYPNESSEANRYLSLLLAEEDSPTVVSKTIPLLMASTDQAEQLHFLFAIRKVRPGWTADLRNRYIECFHRSTSYLGGEGMPGFLKQIQNDFLAAMSDKEKEQFAKLMESKSSTVTETKTERLPQRSFVRQWALSDLEDISGVAGGNRDLENGGRLFAAALCSRCHRVGNQGQLAGPDLTGVSRRFTRRDILQSVISPSLVVAENYHVDRIETTDGRILVGRIIQSGDFRSPALRIVTDPLQPGQFTEIAKRDIESHTTAPTSSMPAGLLDTLTKEEIADLLAFIETGGTGRGN